MREEGEEGDVGEKAGSVSEGGVGIKAEEDEGKEVSKERRGRKEWRVGKNGRVGRDEYEKTERRYEQKTINASNDRCG